MEWIVYIQPLPNSSEPYRADSVYTSSFDMGSHATPAEVVAAWNREGSHRGVFTALAAEPCEDFHEASRDIQRWGAGFDLTRNRVHFLKSKEKRRMHPCKKLTAIAMDEVFYLPDDPHPVDGHPTLFLNEADAQSYAEQVVPNGTPITIKTLKLFTVEKEL